MSGECHSAHSGAIRDSHLFLIFSPDGNNSYYALVINRSTSKLELYSVTSGSWGSALASSSTFTISNDTAYVIKAVVKQERIQGYVVGQSASLTYDASTPVDPGQAGMYSDKTKVKFDDAGRLQLPGRPWLAPPGWDASHDAVGGHPARKGVGVAAL